MATILVTAFEPFAGADCNPSQFVAQALADAQFKNLRLVTATLPVIAAEVPGRLGSLVERHEPAAVLSLGEARGERHIRIERRAVNLLRFQTDNSGAAATDGPVLAGGPSEYWSTFPAERIAVALNAAGIGAALSLSAGTYCCNQVLYHAMHYSATRRPSMLTGFLHLPSLPDQQVDGAPVAFGLALELQVIAVRLAIDILAEQIHAASA